MVTPAVTDVMPPAVVCRRLLWWSMAASDTTTRTVNLRRTDAQTPLSTWYIGFEPCIALNRSIHLPRTSSRSLS